MNFIKDIFLVFKKIYTFFAVIFWSALVKLTVKSSGTKIKSTGKTLLTRNTTLLNNVNFNGLIISGRGAVTIGNNFHSGKGCKIITQVHNYEGTKLPYDETIILKEVRIEDNVWLGDDVTILGGATIHEGAIIQAGSVVTSDIPYCGIAGGHPAKVFKTRNIEHYENLKDGGHYF